MSGSGKGKPFRYFSFWRDSRMRPALSASRHQRCTALPARASCMASAVPHEPAPITAVPIETGAFARGPLPGKPDTGRARPGGGAGPLRERETTPAGRGGDPARSVGAVGPGRQPHVPHVDPVGEAEGAGCAEKIGPTGTVDAEA